jgi:uncharacterized protein involved in response to NO
MRKRVPAFFGSLIEVQMSPIPRLRLYGDPALLSYGFRPFFLFGSIYAGLAILSWLPIFYGDVSVATTFIPLDWHIHEMIYGYVAAVMTGFLLTAIPNWTGRLPIQGAPLLFLVALWIAGRIAIATSTYIGWLPAAVIDISFLLLIAAAAVREIVIGRNWANMKILCVLVVMISGNVVFHLEAHFRGVADYGIRLGIGAAITAIMIIGGRIIPSFTRNWLVRENPGRLPSSFGRFDAFSLLLSGLALAIWVAFPFAVITAVAMFVGGILQGVRLCRWAGDRTIRDRLVLVLHVGFAFVPVGFVLTGLAAFGYIVPSAGIHAWSIGAIGTMTLAVMTRASLGHTGHALSASNSTQAIYVAILVAAVTRVLAALLSSATAALLGSAALAWAAAFLGFGMVYGPLLLAPRQRSSNDVATAPRSV